MHPYTVEKSYLMIFHHRPQELSNLIYVNKLSNYVNKLWLTFEMLMLKKLKHPNISYIYLIGPDQQFKMRYFTYSTEPYHQLNIAHFHVHVRHQEVVGLYVTTLHFRGLQFQAFYYHHSVILNKVQAGHNRS